MLAALGIDGVEAFFARAEALQAFVLELREGGARNCSRGRQGASTEMQSRCAPSPRGLRRPKPLLFHVLSHG